jgi:hypothetical protein
MAHLQSLLQQLTSPFPIACHVAREQHLRVSLPGDRLRMPKWSGIGLMNRCTKVLLGAIPVTCRGSRDSGGCSQEALAPKGDGAAGDYIFGYRFECSGLFFDRALRERDGILFLVLTECSLAPIRKDARYAALLRNMNLCSQTPEGDTPSRC